MTDPTTTNQPDPRDPVLDRTTDERRDPDDVERTSERDPERASAFATRGDPSTTTADVPAGAQRGGVRWVRPTDVAAQAGAAVLAGAPPRILSCMTLSRRGCGRCVQISRTGSPVGRRSSSQKPR